MTDVEKLRVELDDERCMELLECNAEVLRHLKSRITGEGVFKICYILHSKDLVIQKLYKQCSRSIKNAEVLYKYVNDKNLITATVTNV